jgi:hypothetical protein
LTGDVDIRPFPRPELSPLPFEGWVGVAGKVLVEEDDFCVAMLCFDPGGTIQERPGPNDTIVVCIEGEGFTSGLDHDHAHGRANGVTYLLGSAGNSGGQTTGLSSPKRA